MCDPYWRPPERDDPNDLDRELWIQEREMKRPTLTEQLNPKWIKPSMTIQQAANQADARGCTLKASWSPFAGLRIVAVPKVQS